MNAADTIRSYDDAVGMRWTDTLERRDGDEPGAAGDWQFVGMHVNTAGEV